MLWLSASVKWFCSGSEQIWLLRAPFKGFSPENQMQCVWTGGRVYDTNQLIAHVAHFVAFGFSFGDALRFG